MEDEQLGLAVALAREVLHRTGALRVSVALDRSEPAVIECLRLRPIVVREGEAERELPHDAGADVTLPDLPEMVQLPPFEVYSDTGEVAGMIGGLEMLGRAVLGVAELLPGHSVVAAEYETTSAETPMGLAARAGEPLIVLLGDDEFELEV
jgi:hypothetical protein